MFKWIRENIIMVIVIVLLLFFAGFGIFSKYKESIHNSLRTERISEKTKNKDSSSAKEETADEKNYRTAKLKLEHPYTESSEEQKQQVTKAFEEAIKVIHQANHLIEVKGTLENHLSMSQDGMIQTLAMALLVNQYSYQPSQLEVMKSDNDDVV
ncbi:hypothetical protein AALA56_10055, partial [Streptococcus hyointestinalis]|uniref:hypothetical protein n=1 Tax=Streptococcus hyointestinalis TaxID=1337 RepID=UPI00351432B4